MNKKRKLELITMATALGLIATGCSVEEKEYNIEDYDVVDMENGDDEIQKGLTQKLDVKGEDFKLITEYYCDDKTKREWRVTSDKSLYMTVYTEGLSDDTEVYIDNVHIDTTIKSTDELMDGITQDTMDDRIHNTMMPGFPIGNDKKYYGVNIVEGQNDSFITGSYYGFNSMGYGSIESRRYTESKYLEAGVYANKFSIVYDLLVKSPKDQVPRNVSVKTDFIVNVANITEKTKQILEEANKSQKVLTKNSK